MYISLTHLLSFLNHLSGSGHVIIAVRNTHLSSAIFRIFFMCLTYPDSDSGLQVIRGTALPQKLKQGNKGVDEQHAHLFSILLGIVNIIENEKNSPQKNIEKNDYGIYGN